MRDTVSDHDCTTAEPIKNWPPPHNSAAEQALLGALLFDNTILDGVLPFLSPDHFYEPLHGRIFEIIVSLTIAGNTATPTTVMRFFEGAGPVGTGMTVPQYLGALLANAPTIKNTVEYGRTIHELETLRQLIVLGEEIAVAAYGTSTNEPAIVQLDRAEELIAKVRCQTLLGRNAEAILAASFAEIPVPPRRWHIDGWIPQRSVTLISGDGGTGKSLLALQLAVATATGRPWLGFDVAVGPVLYVRTFLGRTRLQFLPVKILEKKLERRHSPRQ